MATLHTSEKTHQGMLPQPPALEPASADNPGVGTKRGTGPVPIPGTGVRHGRGETGNTRACVSRRHLVPADEPADPEPGGRKPTTAVPKPVSPSVRARG